MPGHSRRRFLTAAAATAGVAAFPNAVLGRSHAGLLPTDGPGDDSFGKAKRIIFAVSDGMSIGTLTLADLYSKIVLGRGTFWPELMCREGARNGLCSTYSADSLVTDSAAAATTWSCGQRVNNKAIGYLPDDTAARPILLRARDAGYRTGLVSTAKVTDATPAAFIANVPVRTMEAEIAKQILDRAPNIVLGGGGRFFSETMRSSFTGRYTDNHRSLADHRQIRSLVGIFHDDHIPYALDRSGDDAELPTMARSAIEQLDHLGGGFLLQVEAARVDHAAHNNDAVSMILEQIEFDRTLAQLAAYADARDDTLLIVTTDHGNGNPGLTVYGSHAQRGLMSLANAQRSFDWILEELRQRVPGLDHPGIIREIIAFATGVALKASDLGYLNADKDQRADLFAAADSFTSRLASLLANRNGIAFTSKNHTSDMVLLTARGAGAELFPPVLENTDIAPRILHAMGIERMEAMSATPAAV